MSSSPLQPSPIAAIVVGCVGPGTVRMRLRVVTDGSGRRIECAVIGVDTITAGYSGPSQVAAELGVVEVIMPFHYIDIVEDE